MVGRLGETTKNPSWKEVASVHTLLTYCGHNKTMEDLLRSCVHLASFA